MDITKLLNPSTSVWDNYVPLISDKNSTIAYLTDSIDEPSTYNELCYKLKTASPAEVFTLVINTPGGYIDSAVMLVDAIKSSKAKVIAEISGTVASAGTVITLACDEVKIAEHTAFMIHNYSSSGISGKGHELKAYQNFTDTHLNNSFRAFYKGFLTDKEMQSVIDGQDLWMNKTEVTARIAGTWNKKTTEATEEVESSASTKPRGRPKTK
jgi:ATP-dependent protease ClpP protease subunit